MKKYFAKKVPLIEKAIAEVMPEKYSEEWLEKNIGMLRYQVEPQAWEAAFAQPFWSLFKRGGKRTRPVLTCLTHELFGGKSKEIYQLAAIPEIIHTGTLIIDDLEDHSKIRRGKPTIHKIFGDNLAINHGNYLYFWPQRILHGLDLDYMTKEKIWDIIDLESTRAHVGQGLDLLWSQVRKHDVPLQEYLQMAYYKTGSLVSMAMKLGAVVAKVPSKQLVALEKVAYATGLAYQIRDDILNLKPEKGWGKESGEDVNEGKVTYLTTRTLEQANTQDKQRLVIILAMSPTPPDEIKNAIKIMEKYNVFQEAEEYAHRLITEAQWKLPGTKGSEEAYRVFTEFLDYIIMRKK